MYWESEMSVPPIYTICVVVNYCIIVAKFRILCYIKYKVGEIYNINTILHILKYYINLEGEMLKILFEIKL